MLQHISYVLQSNTSANWFKGHYQNPSTYYQLPLQVAAERATAHFLANGSLTSGDIAHGHLMTLYMATSWPLLHFDTARGYFMAHQI